MIAFDRDVPKNCMVCPCKSISFITSSDGFGIKEGLPHCKAKKLDLMERHLSDRPEWCPWIEMRGATLTDEQMGKYLYVKE